MKSKNVETLIRERAELRDLLEDIMDRIQECSTARTVMIAGIKLWSVGYLLFL